MVDSCPEVHLLVTDGHGITSAAFVGSNPVSSGAGIPDHTLPSPPGERPVVEEDLPAVDHFKCPSNESCFTTKPVKAIPTKSYIPCHGYHQVDRIDKSCQQTENPLEG